MSHVVLLLLSIWRQQYAEDALYGSNDLSCCGVWPGVGHTESAGQIDFWPPVRPPLRGFDVLLRLTLVLGGGPVEWPGPDVKVIRIGFSSFCLLVWRCILRIRLLLGILPDWWRWICCWCGLNGVCCGFYFIFVFFWNSAWGVCILGQWTRVVLWHETEKGLLVEEPTRTLLWILIILLNVCELLFAHYTNINIFLIQLQFWLKITSIYLSFIQNRLHERNKYIQDSQPSKEDVIFLFGIQPITTLLIRNSL